MTSILSTKERLLELLPIGFGLFLLLLVVIVGGLLFSNISHDSATGRASIFGELLIAIAFLFLLCDYLIFHMNKRQQPEKKVYYPNIKLLCVGLLTGLGTAVVYLFCRVSMFFTASGAGAGQQPPPALAGRWSVEVVIFVTLAVLLGLTLWAVVRISQEE